MHEYHGEMAMKYVEMGIVCVNMVSMIVTVILLNVGIVMTNLPLSKALQWQLICQDYSS